MKIIITQTLFHPSFEKDYYFFQVFRSKEWKVNTHLSFVLCITFEISIYDSAVEILRVLQSLSPLLSIFGENLS